MGAASTRSLRSVLGRFLAGSLRAAADGPTGTLTRLSASQPCRRCGQLRVRPLLIWRARLGSSCKCDTVIVELRSSSPANAVSGNPTPYPNQAHCGYDRRTKAAYRGFRRSLGAARFHVVRLRAGCAVRATLGVGGGYLNAWEVYCGSVEGRKKVNAANSLRLNEAGGSGWLNPEIA